MLDQDEQSLHSRFTDFEKFCRKKGLKMTHQRLEIYRELLTSKDHPTVEALFLRVRKRIPTISLDTVYRTLALLEEAGMTNRIQTSEGLTRFESDYGAHHHLICKKCQTIEDFTWKSFDTMLLPPELEAWGAIQTRNIVAEGICTACLKKEKNH